MSRPRRGIRALLSIHDVMPQTLERVRKASQEMAALGLPPAVLLVTPGAGWQEPGLAELHRLARAGHPLAGHGWTHRAAHVRGWRHRLYSALISRQTAEHLALDAASIAALIERNFAWFSENGFAPPQLYVPPAWGLGALSAAAMRSLPFRYYETLTGVFDSERNQWIRLPAAGFEADTPARVLALRTLNAANTALSRWTRRPLRIAVHPYDLELRMADALRVLLHRVEEACTLEQLGRSLAVEQIPKQG